MYLYYQKLPEITEFMLSSDGRTSTLYWKDKNEKSTADFIIHTFKQVPLQNWMLDTKTYIWSIIGSAGPVLLAHFESFVTQGILQRVTIVEINDSLQERLANSRLDKPLRKQIDEIKFKEEEFFYASSQTSNQLSRDEVIKKLEVLLDSYNLNLGGTLYSDAELKTLYRKAALKYHPDRNNGDGSKMSELNMLWSIFNQGVSK